MKKTVLLLMILSVIFGSAEAKEKKVKKGKNVTITETPKVFTNEVDSMSYALGLNVGSDFSRNLAGIPGGKSNIELIIKGFTTAMKNDSALMTLEMATEYFKNYITKAQSQETNVKKSEGEKFLANNMSAEGVNVTLTGLQYKVLVPSEGKKPTANDTVKVHYTGTLINGTKFDSSVDRGEPIEFPLNQVIKGWTEGVQLMSVGSKYKFFVPYTLGYGDQGAGGVIPPFATLIFEVELIDIKPFKENVTIEDIETKKAVPAKKTGTQNIPSKSAKSTNKK
ncbi:MAG: FKBP-type peptidyl-prolyl cis-trans isomerase [Paludibacter sp.]|nr:FKBP-type peptidyl-prolyl cis-trans isomerase [Paludibacter sp.]